MQFQANKPLPFDFLNDSQSELQVNFQEINNIFGVNHFDFTDANAGKHKYSVFTNQESLPQVEDDEIVLFLQEVEDERLNIYARYQTNGEIFPFTPYLAAYIELLSNPNRLNILGTSINLDEDKSGWNGNNIIIYFEHPHKDNQYYVEQTPASSNVNVTTNKTIRNKSQEFFEINTLNFSSGNRFYVRVW